MRHFFDEDYYEYMDLVYDKWINNKDDEKDDEEDEAACYFDVPMPYRMPHANINPKYI